jgi:hypothetical protein
MSSIQIPNRIWQQFIARHGGKFFTIAVRLSDGRELEDVRVDATGQIVGTLFDDGGPLSFRSNDIVAIRSVISPWFSVDDSTSE